MVRLDHLSLPVCDWQKARDWYKGHLGYRSGKRRRCATMRI